MLYTYHLVLAADMTLKKYNDRKQNRTKRFKYECGKNHAMVGEGTGKGWLKKQQNDHVGFICMQKFLY